MINSGGNKQNKAEKAASLWTIGELRTHPRLWSVTTNADIVSTNQGYKIILCIQEWASNFGLGDMMGQKWDCGSDLLPMR